MRVRRVEKSACLHFEISTLFNLFTLSSINSDPELVEGNGRMIFFRIDIYKKIRYFRGRSKGERMPEIALFSIGVLGVTVVALLRPWLTKSFAGSGTAQIESRPESEFVSTCDLDITARLKAVGLELQVGDWSQLPSYFRPEFRSDMNLLPTCRHCHGSAQKLSSSDLRFSNLVGALGWFCINCGRGRLFTFVNEMRAASDWPILNETDLLEILLVFEAQSRDAERKSDLRDKRLN